MPPESLDHGNVGRHVQRLVHDISNCLTPVLGYSEAIVRELGDMHLPPPRYKQISAMSEIICEAGLKAGRLLRELAGCVNRQEDSCYMHDLNEILSDLAAILKGISGRSIQLTINSYRYPLLIQANRRLIERLILNLAVNAKESIGQQGCVAITTGISEEPPDSGSLFSRYATISIADNGAGPCNADIPHLFDSNYSPNSGERNIGVGLASSKLIMDCHLGYLEIVGNIPHGTTVTAYLPLLQDASQEPPVQENT